MKYTITKEVIEQLLPGKWYIQPENDWYATHISESRFNALGKQTLFIAMDQKTWLKGTGNTGIYGQWDNTHEIISKYPHLINGVIAQYPIKDLPDNIPQYIVEDSFEFINNYAEYIRGKLTSKIISITGTVGKTSTKEYLKFLMAKVSSVYATNKNHNSRTGVKLTLSNSMHNPDYIILETAMAALWMKSGSISKLAKPDIAVITEIGVGQKGYDDIQTAAFKSKVAEGIKENGLIILNRDIKEYETLKKYCEVYSKNIFSYGEHAEADSKLNYNNEILRLIIEGEEYEFKLPYTDMGTVHNVVAALTVCYRQGIDLKLFNNAFTQLPQKVSVLQEIPTTNGVLIIDDTYNAEHLSMLNAFKYCFSKFSKRRKILIVGDIVNLGEKSKGVHESLLEPILSAEFNFIATFGADTQYLQQKLPKNKTLGHFSDAEECACTLSKILQKDDVVLIKGSRRNSTIHYIPQLLTQYLRQPNIKSEDNNYIYRWDLIKKDKKILQQNTSYGLGSFILIHNALLEYELKKIELETLYIVTDNVAREGKTANAFGLKKDESYTFLDLITQVILTQKPDCILALAEAIYGNTQTALLEVKKQAENLNIDSVKILNVTGRRFKNEIQKKTIQDLFFIAKAISQFSDRTLSIANHIYYSHQGKVYRNQLLYKYKDFSLINFFIGHAEDRIDVVIQKKESEKIVVAKNITDSNDLAYSIPSCLNDSNSEQIVKEIKSDTGIINILGDTYFGEFYTRNRQKKGINDALQQFGYSFSFEKIAPFFQLDHLNIINLEATFFKPGTTSPLKQIKPFILDANAKETIQELKIRNIHHVVLANNHAKDYGKQGLSYTLTKLKESQISYIGAGETQKQAQAIFEVQNSHQDVAIFNGYWHRNPAYSEFDFYALGEENGVNSLNSLLTSIRKYKKIKAQNKVIVIAHWGVDFKSIHPAQRKIAQRLIESGADLIIGHGPHCIQPIEYIYDKPVIFSIGNGVFNSNGEFERYKVLPFGALIRLNLKSSNIDIYPISIENKKNFWQPYPLKEQRELELFAPLLSDKDHTYTFDQDEQQRYYTRITF